MPGWPAKHNNENPLYQQTTPPPQKNPQPTKEISNNQKIVIILYILYSEEISFFQSIHQGTPGALII